MSSETRFSFGYTVRLWAFGLYVRERITNEGMRDSFGIVQLSGKLGEKPGEKWKHCKASVRELEARRWECSRGKERLTWSSVVPYGWI